MDIELKKIKKAKSQEMKRTCTISVRLTAEEMEEVENAASLAGGLQKGTFARIAVLRAARIENAKALGL